MTQELAVAPLFDVSGRRIPPRTLQAPVNPASNRYSLAQPSIDHSAIFGRIEEHLGGGLSVRECSERTALLLEELEAVEATRALTASPHVPFFLPQQRFTDIGEILETTFLPALGRSWRTRFPRYDFKIELNEGLSGKVRVAPESRYEGFVRAVQAGPVVGVYLPLALAGFSVNAAREQMKDLQDGFVLSGGLEAAAALVGCPEMMMKVDGYAPQLDLSGLESIAPGYGYHFASYGYNLTFNGRYHNGLASDYCSSGLTWISQKF